MSKEILKSLWIKKDLTDYVFNYYGSNWDPETIAELVAFDIYNDASDYAIIDTEEMQKLRKEIRQLVDFIL